MQRPAIHPGHRIRELPRRERGDDEVRGRAGPDFLVGTEGNDKIFGCDGILGDTCDAETETDCEPVAQAGPRSQEAVGTIA